MKELKKRLKEGEQQKDTDVRNLHYHLIYICINKNVQSNEINIQKPNCFLCNMSHDEFINTEEGHINNK